MIFFLFCIYIYMYETVTDDQSGLHGAVIFGIVYGVLFALGVIAVTCFCIWTKSKWIFHTKGSLLSQLGQNIALHAVPADRTSTHLGT